MEPTEQGAKNHLQQVISVQRPGNFEIALKVSDGKSTATTNRVVRLGIGWSANWSPKSDSHGRDVTPMLPLHGNRWGTIYQCDEPGS